MSEPCTEMPSSLPVVNASVVVPVFNDAPRLIRCLRALQASTPRPREIIVVDDGSSDHSGDLARSEGVHVIDQRHKGPSAARNAGAARATSDILVFIDADVLVQPSTVGALVTRLVDDPGIAAVFGSYDASPDERNFLSQYKNLLHHYVHQHGNPQAFTFWSACGAIRASVFKSVGGFTERLQAIEDIEMGYRLRAAGHRVLLDPSIQVTHLKRWTFRSLLYTDIFVRAVPWVRLIFEEGRIPRDLNLRVGARVSAALVGILIPLILASIVYPPLLFLVGLVVLVLLGLNASLLSFFARARGPGFALRAFLMHLLYYLYSGLTFSFCWAAHTIRRCFNRIQPNH